MRKNISKNWEKICFSAAEQRMSGYKSVIYRIIDKKTHSRNLVDEILFANLLGVEVTFIPSDRQNGHRFDKIYVDDIQNYIEKNYEKEIN